MDTQYEAAMWYMTKWLAYPSELGKVPHSMIPVGTFMLHDMKYYIFKYKPGLFGKWLVGVCGGFEGDSLECCGHTFSEMKPYEDDETALKHCVDMVEKVRAFVIKQAEKLAQEMD